MRYEAPKSPTRRNEIMAMDSWRATPAIQQSPTNVYVPPYRRTGNSTERVDASNVSAMAANANENPQFPIPTPPSAFQTAALFVHAPLSPPTLLDGDKDEDDDEANHRSRSLYRTQRGRSVSPHDQYNTGERYYRSSRDQRDARDRQVERIEKYRKEDEDAEEERRMRRERLAAKGMFTSGETAVAPESPDTSEALDALPDVLPDAQSDILPDVQPPTKHGLFEPTDCRQTDEPKQEVINSTPYVDPLSKDFKLFERGHLWSTQAAQALDTPAATVHISTVLTAPEPALTTSTGVQEATTAPVPVVQPTGTPTSAPNVTHDSWDLYAPPTPNDHIRDDIASSANDSEDVDMDAQDSPHQDAREHYENDSTNVIVEDICMEDEMTESTPAMDIDTSADNSLHDTLNAFPPTPEDQKLTESTSSSFTTQSNRVPDMLRSSFTTSTLNSSFGSATSHTFGKSSINLAKDQIPIPWFRLSTTEDDIDVADDGGDADVATDLDNTDVQTELNDTASDSGSEDMDLETGSSDEDDSDGEDDLGPYQQAPAECAIDDADAAGSTGVAVEDPGADSVISDVPVGNAISEEAPVDEAPVKEALVEEIAIEEASVEEAPVEKIAIEEALEEAAIAAIEDNTSKDSTDEAVNTLEDAAVKDDILKEAAMEEASTKQNEVTNETVSNNLCSAADALADVEQPPDSTPGSLPAASASKVADTGNDGPLDLIKSWIQKHKWTLPRYVSKFTESTVKQWTDPKSLADLHAIVLELDELLYPFRSDILTKDKEKVDPLIRLFRKELERLETKMFDIVSKVSTPLSASEEAQRKALYVNLDTAKHCNEIRKNLLEQTGLDVSVFRELEIRAHSFDSGLDDPSLGLELEATIHRVYRTLVYYDDGMTTSQTTSEPRFAKIDTKRLGREVHSTFEELQALDQKIMDPELAKAYHQAQKVQHMYSSDRDAEDDITFTIEDLPCRKLEKKDKPCSHAEDGGICPRKDCHFKHPDVPPSTKPDRGYAPEPINLLNVLYGIVEGQRPSWLFLCKFVNKLNGCGQGDKCRRSHAFEGVLCPEEADGEKCPRGVNCPLMHKALKLCPLFQRYNTCNCTDDLKFRHPSEFFESEKPDPSSSSVTNDGLSATPNDDQTQDSVPNSVLTSPYLPDPGMLNSPMFSPMPQLGFPMSPAPWMGAFPSQPGPAFPNQWGPMHSPLGGPVPFMSSPQFGAQNNMQFNNHNNSRFGNPNNRKYNKRNSMQYANQNGMQYATQNGMQFANRGGTQYANQNGLLFDNQNKPPLGIGAGVKRTHGAFTTSDFQRPTGQMAKRQRPEPPANAPTGPRNSHKSQPNNTWRQPQQHQALQSAPGLVAPQSAPRLATTQTAAKGAVPPSATKQTIVATQPPAKPSLVSRMTRDSPVQAQQPEDRVKLEPRSLMSGNQVGRGNRRPRPLAERMSHDRESNDLLQRQMEHSQAIITGGNPRAQQKRTRNDFETSNQNGTLEPDDAPPHSPKRNKTHNHDDEDDHARSEPTHNNNGRTRNRNGGFRGRRHRRN